MPSKIRLDLLLVERGLAESRERAQRLIRAGQVSVAGELVDKPGAAVASEARIEVASLGERFVSRGGEKLQAALERFALSPAGLICMDLGASTGGFTDCLLQAGALKVYAIDVGHGQLHEKLRADPRVVSREGVNARELKSDTVDGEPIQFCTADLSFISLLKVIPAAAPLLAPGAALVVLVKPQFEAGRQHVRRGGRVLDPSVHRKVLRRALDGIVSEGFGFQGLCASPLRGPAGNREYLACFRRMEGEVGRGAGDEAIDAAIGEAFGSSSS
ncbi:MAG: TlyA family RNA methyltransferase [Candidatus Sumerlaeota bacterium]|nr:TlyA family RNA methyltransferase [Candidatus Sumerlaeota bacterium]